MKKPAGKKPMPFMMGDKKKKAPPFGKKGSGKGGISEGVMKQSGRNMAKLAAQGKK
jgi:hypothetical protein